MRKAKKNFRTLKEKRENFFETLWKFTKNEDLDFIFEYITKIICNTLEVKSPFKLEELTNERDLLEVTIEALAFLYCAVSRKDY